MGSPAVAVTMRASGARDRGAGGFVLRSGTAHLRHDQHASAPKSRRLAGDPTGTRKRKGGCFLKLSGLSRPEAGFWGWSVGVAGCTWSKSCGADPLNYPPFLKTKNGRSAAPNNLIQGTKVRQPVFMRVSEDLPDLWKYRPKGLHALDFFRWFAFIRASILSLKGGRHART